MEFRWTHLLLVVVVSCLCFVSLWRPAGRGRDGRRPAHQRTTASAEPPPSRASEGARAPAAPRPSEGAATALGVHPTATTHPTRSKGPTAPDAIPTATTLQHTERCLALPESQCSFDVDSCPPLDRACLGVRVPWRMAYRHIKCCFQCCLHRFYMAHRLPRLPGVNGYTILWNLESLSRLADVRKYNTRAEDQTEGRRPRLGFLDFFGAEEWATRCVLDKIDFNVTMKYLLDFPMHPHWNHAIETHPRMAQLYAHHVHAPCPSLPLNSTVAMLEGLGGDPAVADRFLEARGTVHKEHLFFCGGVSWCAMRAHQFSAVKRSDLRPCVGRMKQDLYYEGLATTRFVFAPRGWGRNSQRLNDALAVGVCVRARAFSTFNVCACARISVFPVLQKGASRSQTMAKLLF